ncbi:MAG: hypothetical protein RLZZ220_535 [Pseudomonadota bacterium]|jgi:SulP family sulfate permease|nr:STAS domain-containing protein [Zoogloea sp.]
MATSQTAADGLAGRWARYRQGPLGDDLLAAVVVTILLVPQSLAYAMLAGLPPSVGVMASLLPIVAYAALGSSATLAVGPVAVLAVMTAQAIGPAAAQLGVSPHLAALVLAVEMGAVFLAAALLRLEMLAALLAAPVLHGFMTGAVLLIALGQLPALLGLPLKGNTALELGQAFIKMDHPSAHPATALVGLLSLATLWAIRRYGAPGLSRLGIPRARAQVIARAAPILVVVSAIAWAALAPDAAKGVALAGTVSLASGLDFPSLFAAPYALWKSLALPATLLALVAYVESLAVAEALGARRREKVSPRRELLGLAAANVVAGLSGGMPVTGGFARSIVNFDAGARTRMAGVWTALLLGLAMVLVGDLLAWLPRAVLAATILIAVMSLLDTSPFRLARRYDPAEFGLMVLVSLLTLLAGVEPALLVGVLLSLGLFLKRAARPHWTEVGRLAGTDVFRNVRRFPVDTLPAVLSVRVDESLLFINARWITEVIDTALAGRPLARHVVLMMNAVNGIDLSGLEALQHLSRDLAARGVQLHLSELKGPVKDRLQHGGLGEWLSGQVFMTQTDAWQALAAEAPAGAGK